MLNALPGVLLSPFFGLPPGLYRIHHCAVHHGESNGAPGDLSSTERYQRDRVDHFCVYWARFALATVVELPLWAARRRPALALQALAGIAVHVGAALLCARANATAALWLFAVPFAASSLLLMFGNWAQHAFIKPEAPRHPLGMAYTCVNHADNQATFNDGYHASHHANARTHWSELPTAFMGAAAAHGAADALAFHGVHFFEVGVAVLFGRERGLRWLARSAVVLPGAPARSEAQLVAELRRRLAPIRTHTKSA